MAPIAHDRIGAGVGAAALWPLVAARIAGHVAENGRGLREAIVLVPRAVLLPPLRNAFAARGSWQPRVETPATLAAALGPAAAAEGGRYCGDAVLDRVEAERQLAAAIDADAGLDVAHAAALAVDAARTLVGEAAQRAPAERGDYWRRVHEGTEAWQRSDLAAGIGRLDAALLAWAAAWAAEAPPPATDRLHTLPDPLALVVVRVGGADAIAEGLLRARGGLLVDLDITLAGAGGADASPATHWRRLVAEDREDEALAVATTTIEAIARGAGTVAVVALDGVLARRVTALLARRGVACADETGARLAATPAAGRLVARLRAMAENASADALLDWLKSWPAAARHGSGIDALEADWRQRRRRIGDKQAAAALWREARERRAPWHGAARPLREWLALLLEQLHAERGLDPHRDEPDTIALGLRLAQLDDALAAAAQTRPATLDEFTRWIESVCADAAAPTAAVPGARVVLTTLAKVAARPFDHVVLAAADERRLGGAAVGETLLGDALAARLGLATSALDRERRRFVLAQLLRVPQVTVTWRRFDGAEPLAPSPELTCVDDWLRRAGAVMPAPQAWRARRTRVAVAPPARPLPAAAAALPARLSASALEALRDCPYRFYARSVLGLDDAEELDTSAGKREFGTWLHAALHRFHTQRSGRDDARELHAAAEAAIDELKLDRSELLPFRAGAGAFVPAYLRWLAQEEAGGWHWQSGETEREAQPAAWAPQVLHGRIDRIDRGSGEHAGALRVIDYKTASHEALRQRIAAPLEDTQLAFYAALLREGGHTGALRAAYLALDDRRGPRLAEHEGVAATAAVFVARIGAELQRLRAGAPLPALGEGKVCMTCEMRGLCRRDHWPDAGRAGTDDEPGGDAGETPARDERTPGGAV